MAGPALALVASMCLSAPLLAPLARDARLSDAAAGRPGAALDVRDPDPPEVRERPGGGSRYVYALALRADGGKSLATADVACDFDEQRSFLGARLLTVRPPPLFEAFGEVRRGKAFEVPVDSTRTFRLTPFSEGWTASVSGPGGDDCRPLTPPYRGTNALEVFGGDLRGATSTARRFRCAASETDRAAAEESLERVLWTQDVPYKEVDAAVAEHERLRAAAQRGTLVLKGAVLGGPVERPWIERARFHFELRAPGPGEP